MMEKTDMPDDMPIQAGMVSKAIEGAQRQVESMHFAARKNVLEYDDVMNLQRAAIYSERNAILDGKDMDERIPEIIGDAAEAVVAENCPDKAPSDDWDVRPVETWAANMTGRDDFSVADVDHEDDPGLLSDALWGTWTARASKSEQLGEPVMKMLEGQVMLRIIDTRWMAHLQEMDYLKAGIGLRAFGQRDPLVEYKNEAYNAFQNLTSSMYEDYPAHAVAAPGGCEAGAAGVGGGQEPARRKGELLVSRAGSRADGRGRPHAARRPPPPSGGGPRRHQAGGREAADVREGQGRPSRTGATTRAPAGLGQEVQEVSRTRSSRNHG